MTRILPSVAVLELTYRCNHACRFCSCPWFGGMMTPELYETISAALLAGADSVLLNRFLPGGLRGVDALRTARLLARDVRRLCRRLPLSRRLPRGRARLPRVSSDTGSGL